MGAVSIKTGTPSSTQRGCASFYDTTTQQISTAYTAQAVTIGSTDFANGVSINNGSEITFAAAGVYNLQFSLQVTNDEVQNHLFYLWLEKNTAQVPFSNGVATVQSTHGGHKGFMILGWNYFITAAAGDFVELVWSADSNKVMIEYVGVPHPGFPASPSVILTVQKI